MDNTETVNCIEWFFGYGGNHLGIKRVLPSLRCIAACEIEAYALANLVSKIEAGCLDPFPIWSNVKTFPCEQFLGLVDLFIASYPCQGFSSAGERKGQADPRFLWPWVLQGVVAFQPRMCFFENVDGHVSLGLSTVISDLEAAGYRVKEGVFSAAEVGAPQQRKRVFIMAIYKGQRGRETAARFQSAITLPDASRERGMGDDMLGQVDRHDATGFHYQPARTSEPAMGDTSGGSLRSGAEAELSRPSECGCGVGLANAKHARRQGRKLGGTLQGREPHGPACEFCCPFFWPEFVARPGQNQRQWEPWRVIEVKRGLGGGFNGRSSNVDRLRLLGNGVYPATAAKAFVTLLRRFTQ